MKTLILSVILIMTIIVVDAQERKTTYHWDENAGDIAVLAVVNLGNWRIVEAGAPQYVEAGIKVVEAQYNSQGERVYVGWIYFSLSSGEMLWREPFSGTRINSDITSWPMQRPQPQSEKKPQLPPEKKVDPVEVGAAVIVGAAILHEILGGKNPPPGKHNKPVYKKKTNHPPQR